MIDTSRMSRAELMAALSVLDKKRTDRIAQGALAHRRRCVANPAMVRQQYADHAVYAKNRYQTDEAFRLHVLAQSRANRAKAAALLYVRCLFAEM